MRLHSVLFLCAISCFVAGPAKADVVNFQGVSSGHFAFLGLPLGSTVGALTYNQGSGFAGATNAAGTLELLNLGSFTLGPVGEIPVYGADLFDFRLLVNFALPSGVQGMPANFFAELQGQARFQFLQPDIPESVEVEFGNNSLDFTFKNAAGSGSFTLEVDDMTVANGNAIYEYFGPRALTGRIRNATFAAVPEPASVAIFGSAFGAMIMALRCRHRS